MIPEKMLYKLKAYSTIPSMFAVYSTFLFQVLVVVTGLTNLFFSHENKSHGLMAKIIRFRIQTLNQ
jgi:hypothetical protein